jgi:hypothetical protein
MYQHVGEWARSRRAAPRKAGIGQKLKSIVEDIF